MNLDDRVHGCLLGGACGDALGAPVEFLQADEIIARYGRSGIIEFDEAYGVMGAITDDTQMALFTVEGLIRAAIRASSKGISHPPGVVHHAYRRWFITQTMDFESGRDLVDGWLALDRRLWVRRAPGHTCLSALREERPFGSPAVNDSKGCGTVMRDAPFGLAFDPRRAFDLAREAAHTTHGHPNAGYSSAALAAIIAYVMRGQSLLVAVRSALDLLQEAAMATEVRRAVDEAVEVGSSADWKARLPELGEGWVAEEALAIAVACALGSSGAEEAIVTAVNHSGDSDSTGAITGNLVGAIHGVSSLPRRWREQVELSDVIGTLAQDLANVVAARVDPETLWDRYPGW